MPAVKGQKYNISPKPRMKLAFDNMVENGRNVGQALINAGYSPNTAKAPTKVTKSKGFLKLLEQNLPDSLVTERHLGLLNSHSLDHMVFPLGPKGEDSANFSGARPDLDEELDEESEEGAERTTLTDQQIISMLAEVNCTVRQIVHGEGARHVYFWSPDNRARKDAIDLAYKVKGKYPKEGGQVAAFQFNFNQNKGKYD